MVKSPKSVPEQSSPGPNRLSLWRRTPPLVLPMLVLSCGLVVAGAVAVKGIRTATDTVTVTGASTERLRSDYADWTVTVSGNGLSQKQAYQNLQPDSRKQHPTHRFTDGSQRHSQPCDRDADQHGVDSTSVHPRWQLRCGVNP